MHTLTSFFDWLLTASLRASALTVGVCFVQFLLQKHLSPRWRYALWLPVLVVLLMPVLPESRWSAEQVFVWEKPALNVSPVSVIADATASTMPTTATTPPRTASTAAARTATRADAASRHPLRRSGRPAGAPGRGRRGRLKGMRPGCPPAKRVGRAAKGSRPLTFPG